MGVVLTFPVKKELPKEVEDRIYETAKMYIHILNDALTVLSSDEPTIEEFDEIKELVFDTYAKGIDKAIDELEE